MEFRFLGCSAELLAVRMWMIVSLGESKHDGMGRNCIVSVQSRECLNCAIIVVGFGFGLQRVIIMGLN